MPFPWTRDIEAEVIRLREKVKLNWQDIATHLGMDTADVPRIRYSRLRAAGVTGGHVGEEQSVKSGARVPAATDDTLEYEVSAAFTKEDYWFDGSDYFFPVNNQVIRIPKRTWERIVAAYSGEGGNEVQAAIAMDVGMHKKVLEACLRLYGHFKARPPVTREALAAAKSADEMAPLYEKAIEVKEAKFIRGLGAYRLKEQDRIIKDLRTQLHHRDGQKQEMVAALREVLEQVNPLHPATNLRVRPPAGEDFTVLVYLTDTHFGMRVFGTSGFLTEYDTDISGKYVREVAKKAAEWIISQPGRCTKVRLMNGGDVFHAFEKRTRRGTPLERDRPDREVFRHALSAFIDAVETLRQVADTVEYDGTPGNHDGIHEWFLREGIALYFREAANVVVNRHEKKRTFFAEGTSLHVFDHGEEFTRFDYTRMTKAELIARMTGAAFKNADKIYFYVGHTHHHEEKAWGPHLKLIRGGTFAHTNDHEEELVFYGEPEVNIYRLDAKGRIENTKTLYLTDTAAGLELTNVVGQ